MNIASDLLIGTNHTGDPGNPTLNFAGWIDEVAIYGSALTEAVTAWSAGAERRTSRVLRTVADVPVPAVDWVRLAGPYFGNDLMTLHLQGAAAEVVLEQARRTSEGAELREVASLALSTENGTARR